MSLSCNMESNLQYVRACLLRAGVDILVVRILVYLCHKNFGANYLEVSILHIKINFSQFVIYVSDQSTDTCIQYILCSSLSTTCTYMYCMCVYNDTYM